MTSVPRLFASISIAVSGFTYSGLCAGDLIVRVLGAKAGTGTAIASVFSSPENYLKRPVSEQKRPIDAAGQAEFSFRGLETGKYAVSVIYDEDNNGKLNTGLFGIPTEPVGFSNNATGSFGPPSFEDTVFTFTDPTTVVITLGDAGK